MKPLLIALLALLPGTTLAAERPPIIDMHLHAREADYAGENPPPLCAPFSVMPRWDNTLPGFDGMVFEGEPCAHPIFPVKTTAEQRSQTLAIMQRRNIIGMVSGAAGQVDPYLAAAPERVIVGLDLHITGPNALSPDEVRALWKAGRFTVLGEVMAQYDGVPANDPRMEPYWALAEELGIPVGIHMGPSEPAGPYLGSPAFRARNSSPLLLEDVLVAHPKLRVYIMHAGYPFADDLRALLFSHPQVYVDIASIDYTEPHPAFHDFLRELIEAGYGDRILFGSDQMIWPGVIEPAIAVIENAPFLNEAQKRGILYDNAARFLRLSPETIARHKAM